MSGRTHKGIRKRFKKTGTGKLLYRASGKRHLMSSKSAKRARKLSKWCQVSKPDVKVLARQYGKI